MTAPPPLLVARGVHKAFGRRRVLAGVDLVVRPGELVGVVGENGSGKSTLLRIAAGLLAPDGGEVTIDGRLGYCPQDAEVSPNLTVDQHLAYFAAAYRLAGVSRGEALLERLGFARFRGERANALSGGIRQKLNLTLALLHDPDLLLLDEPYQGFDWETYLRFWDLVDDLRAEGRAIVVITHLVFEQARFDVLFDLVDGRARRRPTGLGVSGGAGG